MNTYLFITSRNEFSQYTTKQKCWQDALVRLYEFCGVSQLSIEDFKLLISNKTSDEAIEFFNRFAYDDIEFFGIIHQPFINNLTNMDIKEEQ